MSRAAERLGPYVFVTLVSARGWQDLRFTLAEYARARGALFGAEVVVAVELVGSLE